MGVTVVVGVNDGGKVAVQLGDAEGDTLGEAVSEGAEITTLARICVGPPSGFTDPQAETTTAQNRIEKSLFLVKLPQLIVDRGQCNRERFGRRSTG